MGINWVDQCDLMICHKKTGQLRQKSLGYQSSQSVLPHVEELSGYFMIQVELGAPNPTDWVVFHYVCENCALFLSLRNTSEERLLVLVMITSSCPGFTFTFHEQQSCVGLFSVILRSNSETTVALLSRRYFPVEPLTMRRAGFCHKYGFVWNF